MAKARRGNSRLNLYDSLGRRNGWITRRAIASGKDPARVFAALRGRQERERKAEHAARVHGQKAREKSERKLTPAQKAKRTRDANRIEGMKIRLPKRGRGRRDDDDGGGFVGGGGGGFGGSGGGGGGEYDGGLDDVLDDYGYDDGYYDDYDVETSPDYEETPS